MPFGGIILVRSVCRTPFVSSIFFLSSHSPGPAVTGRTGGREYPSLQDTCPPMLPCVTSHSPVAGRVLAMCDVTKSTGDPYQLVTASTRSTTDFRTCHV